jgi:type IV pilus assembly protein PilM
MALKKAAWGIEVGTAAIKAVRLARDGDDVVVTDFAVIPYSKVLTTPDLDVDGMIRVGLGQFVQANAEKLGKEPIVVSIPGQMAFARFAKLPPVEPKKIPDIVKFEAAQQIPFPIDQVEWDYQTFQQKDSIEVEVGIFAITKERLAQRMALYAECGLFPEALTLSPLALFNAVSYDFQLADDAAPLAVVDVGTSASDVVVAQGGRCWIRTFPLGGTHFTEAIVDSFSERGVNYSRAERLKQEAATHKNARQLMAAMKGVFEQLVEEIRRSRGYYETLNRDTPVQQVLGVGSTLKIPGLRKFLSQQLGVDMQRLDEFKRIRVEGSEAADFSKHSVNLATAYGLALQGLGLAKISVNLTPAANLRTKMWKGKTKWFAAAACLFIAAGALMVVRPVTRVTTMQRGGVPAVVEDAIRSGKNLRDQYSSLQSGSAIGATASNMMALVDYRDVWPHIVNDAFSVLSTANPDPVLRSSDVEAIRKIAPAERTLVSLDTLAGEYLQEPATAGGSPARRIRVAMTVTLTKSDPERFMNQADGIIDWFRKNADRPGVPYTIVGDVAVPNFTRYKGGKEETQTFAAASQGAAADAAASQDSGAASKGTGGAAFKGRRSFSGVVNTQATGVGVASGESSGDGSASFDDGADPAEARKKKRERTAGTADPAAAKIDIAKEAPIPKAPTLVGDEDYVYRGTIVFTVQLRDKGAAPAPGMVTQ